MTPGGGTAPPHPSWKVAGSAAAVMVVLALLGVGLATADVGFARDYWMALVPVYGLLCVFTAWKRARPGEQLVLRQLLHWAGIAGAVALDFSIRSTGLETQVASGLNALLLLALGCFLAGVHLDWLFVPVGLLLTLTLFLVAKADQYLWLLLVAAALPLAVWIVVRRVSGTAAGSAADPKT
jgi:hypothetical protein